MRTVIFVIIVTFYNNDLAYHCSLFMAVTVANYTTWFYCIIYFKKVIICNASICYFNLLQVMSYYFQ